MAKQIEVISSSLVKMANKETTNISRMDLTPLELGLLLLDYIQRGLVFQKSKAEFVIDHLKSSLSCALDFFQPLSGRLVCTKNASDNTMMFHVDCNDAGVEFTHAIARDIYVSDILDPTYTPKEMVSSFFPLNGLINSQGVSNPLFGVQVNELADGYFVAFSANHSVVDGTSFWHFINSWSELSRGLSTISKFPILMNRSFPSLKFPSFDEQCVLNEFVKSPLLERFFRFSKESLAKLKAKANSEAGTNQISTFQALSAHLWRSMTRSRRKILEATTIKMNPTNLFIAVGARSRLSLPDAYFGCAVYGGSFSTFDSDLLQNGLGWAALKINELVSKKTKEDANMFIENWLKNRVIMKNINGTYGIMIFSSPRHDVYGNDFGWGKPIALRTTKAHETDGTVQVYPSPEPTGGIDVVVCLSPKAMQAMVEDAEFMEAVSVCTISDN